VEIKKDTLYFYTIAVISLSIVFYTFIMVNEKQMRIKSDIERTRTLKFRGSQGKDGLGKVAERNRDKLTSTNF